MTRLVRSVVFDHKKMPLRKRIEGELCSEWRERAIKYKEMQREAEELVGCELRDLKGFPDEEAVELFKFHATLAMQNASQFYEAKVDELQGVFAEVQLSINGVHDVHKDREKAVLFSKSKATSPSTSTEHIWTLNEEPLDPWRQWTQAEERYAKQKCFALWKEDATFRPRRVSLANFVDDTFMSTLEESALKDALREFLQMLVYIDRIRNFALLNSVVVMKVAQLHCDDETSAFLMKTLRELPMFEMTTLNAMVPEMEAFAHKLHTKLSGQPADELPSSWSMHLCPFCSHTASNAVVLLGRTCCWKCAAESSSNAIVTCPLTNKDVDIKRLRLERVLVSFLRRFFPTVLKDAPAPLIGTGTELEEEKPPSPTFGLLAALSGATKSLKQPKKVAVSRRQRRLSDEKRPTSLEMAHLDVEVSAILKNLASPAVHTGQTKTPSWQTAALMPLRRRDRSVSEPCHPPDVAALGDIMDLPQIEDDHMEFLEPRNLRGFPLCSANCWCIERQAAACIDFSKPVMSAEGQAESPDGSPTMRPFRAAPRRQGQLYCEPIAMDWPVSAHASN